MLKIKYILHTNKLAESGRYFICISARMILEGFYLFRTVDGYF